jgi:hypothetical protein
VKLNRSLPGMDGSDPKWAEVEKQNVTFHEAAHATVGFALGRGIVSIRLTILCEIEDGLELLSFLGAAQLSPPLETSGASLFDYATIAAAGQIAEARRCRAIGLPDNSARMARDDRANMKRAADWADAPDPKLFLRLARRRATWLLENPFVWSGVCDLARALHEGYWPAADWPGVNVKAMSGDEAEVILRRAGLRPSF